MSTLEPVALGGTARRPVALTRDELLAWGEALGRSIPVPSVIALTGDLGSGKTTLAQAICRGFGVDEPVTSPTFALVHEYAASRGPIFHLDLYRLREPSELTNLAWDDIVNSRSLVIVEWADRAGTRLPPEAMVIHLSHDPDDASRRMLEAGPAC